MVYTANQYNYATPPSSSLSITSEAIGVADKKYFTLFDNVLDGSYYPIDGDVGMWGSSVAGADGILPEPFVFTVEEVLDINAFRLVGSTRCFPVAFTVKFYIGNTLLYTISETDNAAYEYIHYLQKTVHVSSYVVQIARISAPGVAVIYNSYNPGYLKRHDTATLIPTDTSDVSWLLNIVGTDAFSISGIENASSVSCHADVIDRATIGTSVNSHQTISIEAADVVRSTLTGTSSVENTLHDTTDTLRVDATNVSSIENTIERTHDSLSMLAHGSSHVINNIDGITDRCPVAVTTRIANKDLINVHSVMKRPTRHIYGKVYITYTDPMLSSETTVSGSETAYNSDAQQVIDGNIGSNERFFTLYENDLTGSYVVSDEDSQVGWVSKQLSNADGTFDDAPQMRIDFSERPVINLQVIFDSTHANIVRDLSIEYIQANGNRIVRNFTDNNSYSISIDESIASVVAIVITVTRVSRAGYPVVILEVPTMSTRLYTGYVDKSELISIDLLEELTYQDEIEALGGVSANVITVKLDNSSREFFFNNPDSIVASSLRRNRKIAPWLGVEITPGDIEWYTLGTFWSYKWDVPVEGLVATVVGFDTIGLLGTTSFKKHTMQVNKSIGQLIEYILDDAKQQLDFVEYKIDPHLYSVVIPYAWFEASSHTAALRKLSLCYPMHIYCDRDGAICAAPQKLHLDYYNDAWSDSTNVISKKYSSLYTTLPNIINVEVKNPAVIANERLVDDSLTFDVTSLSSRTLNFSKPYVSDIDVTLRCDASVTVTYEVYSWGITFTFTGAGNVYGITCVGTALDISNSAVLNYTDEASVRINGALSRDIKSDFIQTSEHAVELLNRISSLSEYDKYDVEVNYRGDIALTINDPILLLDGIAPDNRYNIKRHELFWNGSLSGVAHLNT